ncbi:MAG: helix-turn-helix domain-containing protein [Dehalococcoidia bacterium]
MQTQEVRMSPSLGETLQSARSSRGVTLEDAERATRIPRKYLEALEREEYGIMPAPVYARGFLRSYAGYLGLDPGELLPFFPVGHVGEPQLEPLPKVKQARPWSMSAFAAVAVVALLVLAVVGIYGLGQDSGDSSVLGSQSASSVAGEAEGPQAPASDGQVGTVPELIGLPVDDAVATLVEQSTDYIVIAMSSDEVPEGQVVTQNPAPGMTLEAGQAVTLLVSR